MAIFHIDEYGEGESYSSVSGKTPDTVYPKLVLTQDEITTEVSSQQ